VCVDFLDELGAGITPVSAADIRDELDLAYTSLALVLLIAPLLSSVVIEGPLLLVSDRWRRERAATIGVALMGLFMIAAGCAQSAWALALALGAWGSAGGLGCGLCQGALMNAYPEARERWMTRWTLMGTLGDVATPLLIVGASALGLGWRAALIFAGILHLIHAAVLSRVRLDDDDDDDQDDDDADPPSLWAQLRAGARDRTLMTWLGAAALTCLLDEILVAFGSLYLRDELGAGIELQGLAFMVCALGGALGLAVSDRLLTRVDPVRLLATSAGLTIVVYAAWLLSATIATSVVALGLLGLVAAPMYPICAAQAYAARPGQPGLVAAVEQLYAPLPLLAPLLVGLVADRFGLLAALAVLALEPIGIGLIALAQLRNKGC